MQRFARIGNRGIAPLAVIVVCSAIAAEVHDWTLIRAAEVEYASARTLLSRQSYAPALEHIRRAQALCPDNVVYWEAEGVLCARWSALASALDPLQPALVKSEPSRKRLAEGIRAYGKALCLAPADSLLHHNIAWLYLINGDSDAARRAFDRAIELDPQEPIYRVSSALWRERDCDFAAAAREYGSALALSPGLADSMQLIAFERRRPSEYQAAMRSASAQLRDEFATARDPLAAARLAKLLMLQGQDADARRLLEGALRELPALSKAWLNLGQLHERSGEDEAARMCYVRTVFLDKSEVFAWERLANRLEREKLGRAWAAYGYRQALRAARQPERIYRRFLYQTAGARPDDVLPPDLVESCSPVRGLAATCEAYREGALPADALPVRMSHLCAALSGTLVGRGTYSE